MRFLVFIAHSLGKPNKKHSLKHFPKEKIMSKREITEITLTNYRKVKPFPIEKNCAAFFWGEVGSRAIIQKVRDYCQHTTKPDIKITWEVFDYSTGKKESSVSHDLCGEEGNILLKKLASEISHSYPYLAQLIVTPNKTGWKMELKVHQFSNNEKFKFEKIIVNFKNSNDQKPGFIEFSYSDSTVDENHKISPQALYQKLIFKRKNSYFTYDACEQILEESYRKKVRPITDSDMADYYESILGERITEVNEHIIRRLWNRNVNPAGEPHDFPIVILKGTHCPKNQSSLIETA